MRRFLYFLPKLPGANPGILRARGVLDRFESVRGEICEHMICPVDRGPGNESGVIVVAGSRAATYDPDRQEWAKGFGGDAATGGWYWVGVEQPWPVPEDLAREMGISGHEVTLSDGKRWRVPILHRWDEQKMCHVPNLPMTVRPERDDAGRMTLRSVVRPDFQAEDTLAREIIADFYASRTVPGEEAFQRAVAVLAVNYQVGPEEVGLIGVLNDADVAKVLALAVDLPTLENQALQMQVNGIEYHEPVIREEVE